MVLFFQSTNKREGVWSKQWLYNWHIIWLGRRGGVETFALDGGEDCNYHTGASTIPAINATNITRDEDCSRSLWPYVHV